MTALHPAKHPRNRTQIAEPTLRASSRGPRSDPHMLQLLHRSRLLEISQHRFVLGNLLSIKLKSVYRHLLEGRFALPVQLCDIPRTRERLKRRRKHQLEISFGKHSIRVLPVHHFALFSDLYLARESALGLRNDRVMRWTTTAPDCSTSSMKQRELYVALVSDLMQRAMGLEDLPRAREHATVLV